MFILSAINSSPDLNAKTLDEVRMSSQSKDRDVYKNSKSVIMEKRLHIFRAENRGSVLHAVLSLRILKSIKDGTAEIDRDSKNSGKLIISEFTIFTTTSQTADPFSLS
jgi:hypothetical protein